MTATTVREFPHHLPRYVVGIAMNVGTYNGDVDQ